MASPFLEVKTEKVFFFTFMKPNKRTFPVFAKKNKNKLIVFRFSRTKCQKTWFFFPGVLKSEHLDELQKQTKKKETFFFVIHELLVKGYPCEKKRRRDLMFLAEQPTEVANFCITSFTFSLATTSIPYTSPV